MFSDMRKFVALTADNCSELISKVDNYSTLVSPSDVQKTPSYFTEPNVCLSSVPDYSSA